MNSIQPGKLDLSQFDNITNAIGKLKVQAPHKTIEKKSTTKYVSPEHSDKDLPKPAPRSSNKPSSSALNYPSSSSNIQSVKGGKRVMHTRQNHGRAVAPPKLPSDILSGSAGRLDNHSGKDHHHQSSSTDVFNQVANEKGVIDFSQSPIASRLLKHSKDYKGKIDLRTFLYNGISQINI